MDGSSLDLYRLGPDSIVSSIVCRSTEQYLTTFLDNNGLHADNQTFVVLDDIVYLLSNRIIYTAI